MISVKNEAELHMLGDMYIGELRRLSRMFSTRHAGQGATMPYSIFERIETFLLHLSHIIISSFLQILISILAEWRLHILVHESALGMTAPQSTSLVSAHPR